MVADRVRGDRSRRRHRRLRVGERIGRFELELAQPLADSGGQRLVDSHGDGGMHRTHRGLHPAHPSRQPSDGRPVGHRVLLSRRDHLVHCRDRGEGQVAPVMVFTLMAVGAAGVVVVWRLVAAGRVTIWAGQAFLFAAAGSAALATGRVHLSPRVWWTWGLLVGSGTGVVLYVATLAFVAVV